MNFLEHNTPRSSDFIVLWTAFFFFSCVHIQILILYRNQSILLTFKRSAKNIKDALEAHELFPVLTTGERCGCHGDVQLGRINRSGSRGSRASLHHQCRPAGPPSLGYRPQTPERRGSLQQGERYLCNQQKGAASPASCPEGDHLQLLR